jgi:hypothetical protein
MMQQLNLKKQKILWNNVETKGANFLTARVVLRVLPMHGNKDLKSHFKDYTLQLKIRF